MAIIYSYPIVTPTTDDLLLGTDQGAEGKPTKNFTISSIVDLISAGATGLGAVIEINSSAKNALGVNQSASDFANISGTGGVTFGSFTDGTMTIINGTGAGFTAITSTDFIGNITGIVKAGSSVAGTAGGTDAQNVLGVTQNAGDNSLRLATTAYVDGKVDPSILQYLGDTGGGPFNLNLVSDDFKIAGTANQIETTAATVTGNVGIVTLKFPTAGVTLPNGSVATTQAAADDSTKVATTAFVKQENDLQDLDFTTDNGSGSVLLNNQTLTLSGTADQITTSGNGQAATFALTSSVEITGTFTGTTFSGDLNGTVNTLTTGVTQAAGNDSTKIATTAYVDAAAGAKVLQYQGDTGGPFDLNLKDDDLDIAGGSNISTTAATVAANLGVITIDLNDDVTISGTSKAGTFTTTAGVATWTTTVLAGFTSITSTTFIADNTASVTNFQGNASSATKLGSSNGSIQLSAGSGATLGVGSDSVIYTNGGDIQLTTTLQSSTVTGKVLTGLPTPAAATVVASDTILQGFGKLQSQINGIADGLQFQGTWNANIDEGGAGAAPNGTPALTSGGGEASSGTTDATTADELVDSTKNFTTAPNIVVVGDKVINQVDGQEALVNDITNAASGRLGLAADIMLTGEAYIIDKSPFITAGHYYVVNTVGATTAKNATLNGIQDWQIGDWVIASTTNVWQKLNNSAVEGSGTENRLPKWTAAVSTLVDSDIIDNGTTIKLENDTELGAAAGDAIKSVGVLTTDQQLILKKGLGVGATPSYGATGQALFTSAGSANPPVWTDVKWVISDGTNTSDIANAGTATFASGIGVINTESSGTVTTALRYEDVNADPSSGALNFIDAAATSTTPLVTDFVLFSDQEDTSTKTSVKKALISKLPFNSYLWKLDANSVGSVDVTNNEEVDFVGANGITITKAYADPTHTVTITGVADPVTGTGTALNLPVWNSGGTSIGDSMVKQDAATGTTLTISGVEPSVVIDDTTTDKGSLTISRAADATTYMSSGTSTSGSETFGTHVFSQTEGTNPRSVLTLNSAGNVIPTANVIAGGYIDAGAGIRIKTDTDAVLESIVADKDILLKGTDNTTAITALKLDMSEDGDATFSGNITQNKIGLNTFNGRIRLQNIPDGGNGISMSAVTDKSPQISFTNANNGFLAKISADTNRSLLFNTGSGSLLALELDSSQNAEFKGNVEVDGNLTVDGQIIHGGTHGGGGTYYKEYTTGNAGVEATAFTLTRATSGALMFSVYLTGTLATDKQFAKMYQVAHTYGQEPIYNKVIDSGPLGADITVDFDDSSNTAVICKITPVTENSQPIGITVIVGHGATAVTFA